MANIVTPQKLDIYEEDIAYRSAVSEELLRKLAASINAINRDALMPLGSMITSFLPEAQFQLLTSTAWVLSKGQVITTTDYGQFLLTQGLKTGTVTLPDMRGMVPVGVNNGRADGNQNTVVPSLALGGFMPSGNKSHDHFIANDNTDSAFAYSSTYKYLIAKQINLGDSSYDLNLGRSSVSDKFVTAPSGQTQTTVNSIGVNYFIKVWNVAPA